MRRLGISFDSYGFSRAFVARRSRRFLKAFLDSIGGKQAVIFMIEKNKNIGDYVPPEQRYEYKRRANQYKFLSDSFSNDDIYSWIPDEYKAIFESHPGGQEWAQRQVSEIRQYLFS